MKILKNNFNLILFFALFIMVNILIMNKLKQDNQYEMVIVTEGDSLWTYAEMYANDVPYDRWIEEVMKMNNLASTTIYSGEELQIPGVPNAFPSTEIATYTMENKK